MVNFAMLQVNLIHNVLNFALMFVFLYFNHNLVAIFLIWKEINISFFQLIINHSHITLCGVIDDPITVS
jgi:hypothetical protein